MFFSKIVTVVAGTPERLATNPIFVNRIIVTPLAAAGSALVYVICQDPSVVPMTTTNNDKVTQLGTATATIPVVPFVLNRLDGQPPLNLQEFGIDGSHSGDTVLVSYEV